MAAPQITVAEMVLSVRDNLDEAFSNKWTDPMLVRFLNRAQDAVHAEVRKLKKGFFEITRNSTDGTLTILGDSYAASGFAIVAGTATYTLPPDFLEMTQIECITSGHEYVPFTYMAKQDARFLALNALTTNQSPNGFYYDIEGERTLRITPKSDTALDLRITYVRILPKFTATAAAVAAGTETMEMPHPLYMCVEECATWRAKLRDNDAGAGAWSQVAQASVQRFIGGGSARQSTDAVYVSDPF